MHALGLEFGSAAQLSKRPGSVWNCLWGNALKRSPGIIRKNRVSYPGPGFLSSATWPSLPKKHYNGLNQTKPSHCSNGPPPPFQEKSVDLHIVYMIRLYLPDEDHGFDPPIADWTYYVLLRKDGVTSIDKAHRSVF